MSEERKKDERKDSQAVADMLTVLKSPEMRRVLLRILAQTNLMHGSYFRGDQAETAFREGLRAVGIWLKKQIDNADPEAFARLLTERRKEV